jgi:hypothetical protein
VRIVLDVRMMMAKYINCDVNNITVWNPLIFSLGFYPFRFGLRDRSTKKYLLSDLLLSNNSFLKTICCKILLYNRCSVPTICWLLCAMYSSQSKRMNSLNTKPSLTFCWNASHTDLRTGISVQVSCRFSSCYRAPH